MSHFECRSIDIDDLFIYDGCLKTGATFTLGDLVRLFDLKWAQLCVILNSLIVHVNWLPMINHQTTSAKFSPSSLPYSIPCLIIWRSLFLFLKYWNNFGDKSRVQNLWVISEIGDYFHLLSNGVQTFYTRNVGMMSHKRSKWKTS